MFVDQAIYKVLESADLTVYQDRAPRETPAPYVVFTEISGTLDYAYKAKGLTSFNFQFACYGSTAGQAAQLRGQVQLLLEDVLTDNSQVAGVFAVTQSSAIDDDTGLFARLLGVDIHYSDDDI